MVPSLHTRTQASRQLTPEEHQVLDMAVALGQIPQSVRPHWEWASRTNAAGVKAQLANQSRWPIGKYRPHLRAVAAAAPAAPPAPVTPPTPTATIGPAPAELVSRGDVFGLLDHYAREVAPQPDPLDQAVAASLASIAADHQAVIAQQEADRQAFEALPVEDQAAGLASSWNLGHQTGADPGWSR